jgi:hypothetical protein
VTPTRRLLGALALAALFGVVAGLVKGNDPGLRGAVGNLSAPWLLVGFLPALRSRTLLRGAATGLAATLVALAGFYAVLTVVLAGHLGGGGPVRELLVEVRANHLYFLAGAVCGPLAGAAGAWLGRSRGPATAWVVAGVLLATEVLVVALVQGRQLLPAPLYFRWGVSDWRAYVGEAAVGLAVLAAVWWRRQPRPFR